MLAARSDKIENRRASIRYAHKGGYLLDADLIADRRAIRVHSNRFPAVIDHILQPNQSASADVEDFAPNPLLDQTKHNFGGTVSVEKLQFAIRIQKQASPLQNVVNGVFLQSRADESTASHDQPIAGGVLDTLLGQQLVEPVRGLARRVQWQIFAGGFRRRTVRVNITGRNMQVALVAKVLEARTDTAHRGFEILLGVAAGQDLAGVPVSVDKQAARLSDAGGVVFTMDHLKRSSGFFAIASEAGSNQPPSPENENHFVFLLRGAT